MALELAREREPMINSNILKSFTLVFMLSAFVKHAQAIELNVNLLINSDFSNGLSFWKVHQPSRISSNGLGENSNALLLTIDRDTEGLNEHRNHIASQCVNIDDGDEFTFDVDVKYLNKPIKEISQRVLLVWYQGLDCSERGQRSRLLDPEVIDGWQHLSMGGMRPPLGSQSMMVRLLILSNASKVADEVSENLSPIDSLDQSGFVSALWDNFELKALARLHKQKELTAAEKRAADNALPLFENYFEQSAFDTLPESVELRHQASWVDTVGRTGAGSIHTRLQSDGPATGFKAFTSCVDVVTNTVFDAGIFFKRDTLSSQSGSANVIARWFDGLGCTGRDIAVAPFAFSREGDGWQNLKIENLRRPEGVMSFSLSVTTFMKGAGQYAAFWDDMYLVAKEQ